MLEVKLEPWLDESKAIYYVLDSWCCRLVHKLSRTKNMVVRWAALGLGSDKIICTLPFQYGSMRPVNQQVSMSTRMSVFIVWLVI